MEINAYYYPISFIETMQNYYIMCAINSSRCNEHLYLYNNRWLILTKKDDEANHIIAKIYPISNCNKEKNTVSLIFLEIKESIRGSMQNYSWKTQCRDLRSWRISQRYNVIL